MEVKLKDNQKVIIEGVTRSSIFLVVIRELGLFISCNMIMPLITAIFNVVILIFNKPYVYLTKDIKGDEYTDGFLMVLLVFCSVVACIVLTVYVIAKFCGLFKYLSQFKVWKSFSILLLLSVMLNYFFMLNLNTFKLNYNVKNTEIVYAIIPAYFVFLFLNFLTKKFPTPFEQIGYLFSFEFYKNLFKRISKNKFFKNEPF